MGGFELALQENAAQAAQLALDEVYGLGCEAFRSYPDGVLAITPDQVAEAAARYLDPERRVEVLLGPG